MKNCFDVEQIQRGTAVWARHREAQGQATGGRTRSCRMEGCLGRLIDVRWSDNKLTFPCSEGIVKNDDGSLEIV